MGKIKTSKYVIEGTLIVFDDAVNFDNRVNNTSNVFIFNKDCYENFDFSNIFFIDNESLQEDSFTEIKNTITAIKLAEEKESAGVYAITGNYKLTYIRPNKTSNL